jgi:glycosyltransferase involved in cell wall biosynthesis
MASERAPVVSIGVPVYNGERHLRTALDSLLAQSHSDLELILSDNASTDATWDICTDYARRDTRVRAFRQDRNLGLTANWNFVVRQARGRFFKWASASDMCAPVLIERCLVPMQDDDVVLTFGRTCFIDEDAHEIGVFEKDFAVEDARPSERFRRVCHQLSINNALNGLIRLGALKKTRLHRPYPHSDRVLMAELAIHGRFVLLPEVLLYRRAGPEHFTALRSEKDLRKLFQPEALHPLKFVHLRRHCDFVASALRSPVPLSERFNAAMAALRGMYWDRAGLRDDLSVLMSGRHA